MENKYKFIGYEEHMTMNEDCWFVFEVSPDNKKDVVFYYNPKEDKSEDYKNLKLKDFFEDFASNHFCSKDEVFVGKNDETIDNLYWKASVKEGPEIEDFNEESSWTELNLQTTYIMAVKNIKVEDIPKIFDKIFKEIEGLENDEAEDILDAKEEAKDPYGYRGLRRSDFY